MSALSQRSARIAVTLIPLLLVLLHAVGALPMGVLHRLDNIVYDARLRATLAHTLEPRIVIVDIDEKSLAEVGRFGAAPMRGSFGPVAAPERGKSPLSSAFTAGSGPKSTAFRPFVGRYHHLRCQVASPRSPTTFFTHSRSHL